MDVYYPPVGFYFKLSFTGVSTALDASFQEVSGITAEMTTDEVAEGGENRFKYRLPNPMKFGDLVLKRGMVTKSSELVTWCNDVLGGGLATAIETKTITVSLLDADANPLKTWDFIGAYPTKWELSNLNSEDNKLVVETLSFTYNYFSVST